MHAQSPLPPCASSMRLGASLAAPESSRGVRDESLALREKLAGGGGALRAAAGEEVENVHAEIVEYDTCRLAPTPPVGPADGAELGARLGAREGGHVAPGYVSRRVSGMLGNYSYLSCFGHLGIP